MILQIERTGNHSRLPLLSLFKCGMVLENLNTTLQTQDSRFLLMYWILLIYM